MQSGRTIVVRRGEGEGYRFLAVDGGDHAGAESWNRSGSDNAHAMGAYVEGSPGWRADFAEMS